tara:strand:+ start:391 stop:513 length:123 start_codon:yes stop_codon:yes gene_type:complete
MVGLSISILSLDGFLAWSTFKKLNRYGNISRLLLGEGRTA